MAMQKFESLRDRLAKLTPVRPFGRVVGAESACLKVAGLNGYARIGDHLRLTRSDGVDVGGEVVQLAPDGLIMLPDNRLEGIAVGNKVFVEPDTGLAPCDAWIGRIIDPYGVPLDGKPMQPGAQVYALDAPPPPPAQRKKLGDRMDTGMVLFNTILPLARGQRIGIFAGSGVGKTSLLAHFARHMEAEVVVIALVGERGRELREFIDEALGPQGMQRSIVVAATSDRSALVRRRCPAAATAIAEYFRDQGRQVLLLTDSITRFAEAHREVATTSGELPALRGYPPSMSHSVMSLCERAGPGTQDQGDITAIYTVLVAGSDMDEPVADVLRGVLDGHVTMDRAIAERGRFPAVDILRSVSRSLPGCATDRQNDRIATARKYLGAFAEAETMVRAGLYADGSDLVLDQALVIHDRLDALAAQVETGGIDASFEKLERLLAEAEAYRGRSGRGSQQLVTPPGSQ
ncbi:FliI/YscN family ATPase [Primorskyibacter aestuariivivens]|uniref:FliI/YscN family ATPase n=1 Tax=Primorskyibacter aestuariivivens TaxID=1888912 RepID=UPI002301970F|nr:FliI/YscN family ATPase [Primorskyibacter aestuariivivens]MDA7430204.1 FliI/YscN family ATPase [Primorskyibacter aestuariivivens]